MPIIKPIKIIFFGTPEFAASFLKSLLADNNFEIAGVITQPDKPSGRKQELLSSPVKKIAIENNLKIFQPETLKNNSELTAELKKIQPDLLVVVAFGQIIPPEILALAKSGNINVHPSLLPKYRGASPAPAAILNGDKITGLTIMLMDEKMDHGPILAQREITLKGDETNGSLHQSLTEIGVLFLIKTIKKYLAGDIKPIEQKHSEAVFCRTIAKEEAKINWSQPVRQIERQIRAFYPWPVAWTEYDSKRIKIFPPVKIIDLPTDKKTGEIFTVNGQLTVAATGGALLLDKIQPADKKEMTGRDFVNGNKEIVGKILE